MAATADLVRALYAAQEAWTPKRKGKGGDKTTRAAIQFTAKIAKRKPTAKAAKAQVARVARRAPQAMVKVSKATYGASHTLSNFTYISRNGKVAMFDQDGREISDLDEMLALAQEWHELNFNPEDLDTRHNSPDARRLILSMPRGTDSDGVLQAAAATARQLFGDKYDYVYALHTDEGKEKSPHPHVHLTVRARSHDGEPLAFGPDDILYMRRVFATELRQRGIDADATPQIARGPRITHDRDKVYQARLRVEKNNQDESKQKQTFERDMRRMSADEGKEYFNADVVDVYTDLVRELIKSPDSDDRKLGESFGQFVQYNFRVPFDVENSPSLLVDKNNIGHKDNRFNRPKL